MAANIPNNNNSEIFFEENKKFWMDKLYQAHSAEELNIWREKVKTVSDLLMHHVHSAETDGVSKKNPVLCNLEEAAEALILESDKIYSQRIKEVPDSTNVGKKALWPLIGVGLISAGLIGFFGAPAAMPVSEIFLGGTTLIYTLSDAIRRGLGFKKDVDSKQSLEVQENSGIKLSGALIGVGLGIVSLVELAGVFTPQGAIIVASLAALPVMFDMAFRAKDYFFAKKEIKEAIAESDNKMQELDDFVTEVTSEENLQNAIKNNLKSTPASKDADVDALFAGVQKPHSHEKHNIPVIHLNDKLPKESVLELESSDALVIERRHGNSAGVH